MALNEALQPLQNEIDGDYDQRLYDALWQAYFRLSIDQSQSVTFNFIFSRKDRKTEEVSNLSLRLRVEAQKQGVLLGLLEDF
jgi:serine phosphatase RsbU (regulator of sigma subunit)